MSGPLGASLNRWEYMTFVCDNGTKSIYRDATLIASGIGAAPLNTNLDADPRMSVKKNRCPDSADERRPGSVV